MKQNDKIIRKGDYYELQVIEQTILQQKQIKKQEISSSLSIPGADQILSDIPTYAEARNSYFFSKTKRQLKNCGLDELQEQLREMLNQKLNQQQIKSINNLISQIQTQKEQNIIPLNKLTKLQKNVDQIFKIPKELKLNLQLNLEGLQQRLKKLQELNYPQLSQVENIIEIMLGQKTANSQNLAAITNNLNNLDQKTKEQIQSLYSHLNTLTCLNNLYGLIQDIHHNDSKYIEMGIWVKRAQMIAQMNKDFKMELDADFNLLSELQKNFKENISNLKIILEGYRTKIAQIKKNK